MRNALQYLRHSCVCRSQQPANGVRETSGAASNAAYVSGFTKCSSFPQLQAAASEVSTRFLPFSLCLPEINFAESLAKMSGWFLGRGGGKKKNWQRRLSTPPSFLFLFHLSFALSVALSLSPFGLFVLNSHCSPFQESLHLLLAGGSRQHPDERF